MPKLRYVLLLLPLAGIVVWVASRAGVQRSDPAEVLHALKAAAGPILPEAKVTGAAARSDLDHYNRESLYEFIDGAAEAYLQHGFEQCVAATYRFDGTGGGFEVAAEAHRFTAPAGARAQLDAECPSAGRTVAGVPGAVSDGTLLLAAHDRDMLKLTAYAQTPAAAAALERIAAAWSGTR